jgi:hypothetical protein
MEGADMPVAGPAAEASEGGGGGGGSNGGGGVEEIIITQCTVCCGGRWVDGSDPIDRRGLRVFFWGGGDFLKGDAWRASILLPLVGS